jgi:hypothetical protein
MLGLVYLVLLVVGSYLDSSHIPLTLYTYITYALMDPLSANASIVALIEQGLAAHLDSNLLRVHEFEFYSAIEYPP